MCYLPAWGQCDSGQLWPLFFFFLPICKKLSRDAHPSKASTSRSGELASAPQSIGHIFETPSKDYIQYFKVLAATPSGQEILR